MIPLFLACFLTAAAGPATAQGLNSLFTQDESAPDPDTVAGIDRILERAAETGAHVIFIDANGAIAASDTDADTLAATGSAMNGSRLMKAQDGIVRFRNALVERLLDLPAAFNEVVYILRATSPDGTIWAFFRVLYLTLALVAVGWIVEVRVFRKYITRGIVVSRMRAHPQGYSEKTPFLVFRFVIGVMGILVSMLVAYALGLVLFGPLKDPSLQFTASIINIAYFLSRTVAQLWRMILSPYLAQYRLPPLRTQEARGLYLWLVALGTVDICTTLFGIWIAELGLNYDVFAFLAALLSGTVVLLNIAMILINRSALTNAIRLGRAQDEVSFSVRLLALLWAPAAILYLLFAWIALTYDLVLGTPPGIPLIGGAYLILTSILVVYGMINFGIERSFARARTLRSLNEEDASGDMSTESAAQQREEVEARAEMRRHAQHARMTTFEALARRVAGILALGAGINAFFYIWDNDSAQMVESTARQFLDILAILFLGYIAYHAFRIWFDKQILEEQGEAEEGELGDEGSGSNASRLATLLPLFRNFILVILVVTIVLIVLMELGVNVGPLFAGAGVVGVAVGFGSQALVRDIFSGGFFLFDDAFRKGEYLDVGGVKGTVEKISVRSFQLRHHLGALHTIPFGEIQVMTNYSRDWVIMKLPLRVTYDTDVEKVRKLIKKLGIALLDDPVIGENFIQPLKSQGVIEMQDSAMIIRVKFMTKPGDQWLVRKKVYEEIRELFAREGIRFAHREVTVRLAGDKDPEDLSDEERKAVSAAAHAAIDEEQTEGGTGDGADDR